MTQENERKYGPNELEAVTLGLVWRDGPCTPYMIRQEFLDSPSTRWSGSAGAIYPLVRRLELRKLVRSRPGAHGRRAHREYRITRSGKAALERWLVSPIGSSGYSIVHDPLRIRMYFLRALPRREALSFVSHALEALGQVARETQDACRSEPARNDLFEYLATRNILLITKARMAWLKEVHTQLQS